MKKVFYYADRFVQKSSWKELSILKVCLFSMGIFAGMQIPKKGKKIAGVLAAAVFLATCIPLMVKFIQIIREESGE